MTGPGRDAAGQDQDVTPAVTVQAGLAAATGSPAGPGNEDS